LSLEWEFLTVAEVAEELHVNQQTVRNWIDEGKLTALRIGRRVRIQRSALATYLGIDPPAVTLTRPVSLGAPAADVSFDSQAVAAALDQLAAGFAALAAAVRGPS